MGKREVTERDFRMPEFMDARTEDYEFRDDGKLVRKDRWERGIHTIRSLVGMNGREFEIPEVVQAVRVLVSEKEGWITIKDAEREDLPMEGVTVSLRLNEGSVLRNARYGGTVGVWTWAGSPVEAGLLDAWKENSPR